MLNFSILNLETYATCCDSKIGYDKLVSKNRLTSNNEIQIQIK